MVLLALFFLRSKKPGLVPVFLKRLPMSLRVFSLNGSPFSQWSRSLSPCSVLLRDRQSELRVYLSSPLRVAIRPFPGLVTGLLFRGWCTAFLGRADALNSQDQAWIRFGKKGSIGFRV